VKINILSVREECVAVMYTNEEECRIRKLLEEVSYEEVNKFGLIEIHAQTMLARTIISLPLKMTQNLKLQLILQMDIRCPN
jgi:hypothetical protein